MYTYNKLIARCGQPTISTKQPAVQVNTVGVLSTINIDMYSQVPSQDMLVTARSVLFYIIKSTGHSISR